jgi:hypothetical protein
MEEQKEKDVDKEIAIVGEPTINPATCKFTIDRPVYPGGSAYFGNRSAAQNSPLAQKVFEIPEVESGNESARKYGSTFGRMNRL